MATVQTSGSEQVSGPRSGNNRKGDRKSPVWVSADDQRDLRYYFRSGLTLGAGSTTQVAIVMLSQKRVAIPCRRCGGGDPESGVAGSGFVDSRTGKAATAATEHQDMLLAMIDIDVPPPIGDQLCRDCDGRGWLIGKRVPRRAKRHEDVQVPPASPFRVRQPGIGMGMPNAWPTCGPQSDAVVMAEESQTQLARIGKVSRRLNRLRELEGGTVAAIALDAYFSPDGGSIGALWHLTPAGRKLLRNNPRKLPPVQLYANLRAEQEAKPTANRRALFDAADDQSRKLFGLTCDLWNRTSATWTPETPDEAHENEVERALRGDG